MFTAVSKFILVPWLVVGTLVGQSDAAQQDGSDVEQTKSIPIYRVNVVSRTTKAVNYRHHSGSTKLDFRGTDLTPQGTGEAKVESRTGRIEIHADFDHLQPANGLILHVVAGCIMPFKSFCCPRSVLQTIVLCAPFTGAIEHGPMSRLAIPRGE